MLTTCNDRLLLIEQALTKNAAVLAQLQPLARDRDAKSASSAQSGGEESDQLELDRLREWVVRLRTQVARTERRVERLRAGVERHDALLADTKNRIVWSSGGCAVLRARSGWDAHADVAASSGTVNSRWPPLQALQIPPQKLQNKHDGAPWTAAVDHSGVTPRLSQSFTSLSPVKRRHQHSDVHVSSAHPMLSP